MFSILVTDHQKRAVQLEKVEHCQIGFSQVMPFHRHSMYILYSTFESYSSKILHKFHFHLAVKTSILKSRQKFKQPRES